MSTQTLYHLLSPSQHCCLPWALAAYDDIMKLIEEEKLVIHPEETAPDYVREE